MFKNGLLTYCPFNVNIKKAAFPLFFTPPLLLHQRSASNGKGTTHIGGG
jgi:hypothetical protein